MKQQRKRERIPFTTEVVINGLIKGTSLDINEGGMFIATQAEFIPNSQIDLSFKIKEEEIKIKGVILHTVPQIGIGVKFINPPPALYLLLKSIEDLQAIDNEKDELPQKKILLVDDSAQSRAIYKNKLLSEGYNVVEASNGTEAMKLLQAERFDLVILDLWMEGIDGFKILQLMKLNPELKDIPVVILSGRCVPEDVKKAISLGAKEFLPKMTTSPVKLADRIRNYLQ